MKYLLLLLINFIAFSKSTLFSTRFLGSKNSLKVLHLNKDLNKFKDLKSVKTLEDQIRRWRLVKLKKLLLGFLRNRWLIRQKYKFEWKRRKWRLR